MKYVLSVGQCVPDHSAISALLADNFEVTVQKAALADEAIAAANDRAFDLILINRKLDADHSDGSEIIRQLKANDATASVPVMLITNFPEHDTAAVEIGAISGFGKAALHAPETLAKLAAVLA